MPISSHEANTGAEAQVPPHRHAALDGTSGAGAGHDGERTAPLHRLYVAALAVWFALLVIAFINGAVRELVLVRLLGPAALPVSGITAMVLFATTIAVFVRRTCPPVAVAARIGVLWLVLTLATETGLTLAAGHPVSDVFTALGPSGLARGNLLLPLLVVTTLAPAGFARLWTAS